jgi:hypothetical protein
LIAVAGVAALTTHLAVTALNDGVRRAFILSGLSSAALAVGELLTMVDYIDLHAQNEYVFSAAAFVVGSALLACGFWLWSKEEQSVAP